MKFLILFLYISCSSEFLGVKTKNKDTLNIKNIGMTNEDYKDQLESLKGVFLSSPDVARMSVGKQNETYLNTIAQDIIKKNELFFLNREKVSFEVIDNKTPFHFSLPGRTIFLSSGLIEKYIKSEKLLYCVISYELIRIEKNLYNKVSVVPTGSMTLERMIGTSRLKMREKVEIHKWAFHVLNRVGIDVDNYLAWLQIQNRNSMDFSMQLGDVRSISREESLFKSFLIKNSTKVSSTTKYEGSSRNYYRFINSLKRTTL